MKNNDSNKNIIIIILLLIIVGLSSTCIYFALDRNNTNEQQNEIGEKEENKDKIEEVELTETEKNKFMNEIIAALDKSQYTVTAYSKGKLNDAEKIKFAILAGDKFKQNISYSDLVAIAKKYLGSDGEFAPQDISGCFCGKKYYEYNSNEKIFYSKLSEHGHGGTSDFDSPSLKNYFVDGFVVKENGEIKTAEIKVKKSFKEVGDVVYGGSKYGTYEDAKSAKDPAVEFTTSFGDSEILEHIKNNPHLYPTHTYSFVYEDGEYHLVSIAIEK